MSQRGVEWLCARECGRFSLRHRRYLLIALFLYWHSLRGWKRARVARYGYCFLQLYDDIMDGDRRSDRPPDTIAAETIDAWTSSKFHDDSTLSRLGAAFHAELRSLPLGPHDDPRRDVLVLLEAMRLDAQRVAERRILARSELDDQLRRTFHHSLNLLLIASGHRTRASQVPDLVRAMGWCSVVRDLDEDLRRGLINIPADVVTQVRSHKGELTSRDPDVQSWLAHEEHIVRPHLANSAAVLQVIAADDPGAGRLLRLFQRSVEKYVKGAPIIADQVRV